jgi:KUP system potassium uptake protein
VALINRTTAEGEKKKWTLGIMMLGVFATALFYGDSMITPAISVLSAVEGLTTVRQALNPMSCRRVGILVTVRHPGPRHPSRPHSADHAGFS